MHQPPNFPYTSRPEAVGASRRDCLKLGLAGLMGSGASQAAEPVVLRYPAPQSPLDTRGADWLKLLEAVLQRTDGSHGPAVRLAPSHEPLSELRQFAELDAGSGLLHVTVATPSARRKTRAIGIDFDVRRGLLGMRISLVDQQRAAAIASIRELEDLRRFTIGQGLGWVDVDVYRSNGLEVVTAPRYDNLFRMLLAGRFDLFPRGVGEVYGEFDSREKAMPRLAVEPSLLLAYPAPCHLYFAPGQVALAARVEKGLLAMKADGSFDAHLWRCHGAHVTRARLQQRRVIRLGNPELIKSTDSSVDADLAYWLNSPAAGRR
jgi:ABC-type amino acid transport substrate-binding protein